MPNEAKGGYKNSPCNGCTHNKYGSCRSYCTCERYIAWLNKCWEDFRRWAEKALMEVQP